MGLEHNIKLRVGLKKNNCPASAFSVLASPPLTSKKYSQQTISQFTAGTKELSNEDAAELLGVVNVMTHLQSIVTPKIPVDWSNVLGVRDVLVQTYEKYKELTDPLHKRCWFIRLSVMDFFAGFRSDGSEIRTVNYYESGGLAFTDGDLASEVVKKLKARDIISRVELLTCSRRQSTITTSLEQLGV